MDVEIHATSAFSFLRAASLPEDLVHRAADLGYRSVALLDQASCCVHDDLCLLDLPRARALDRGRPIRRALRPRHRRSGGGRHVGDSTTIGIDRSVRVW